MYILFINSSDRYDIFFSTQFNNNSNKKNCPTHELIPIQPDPCELGWTFVMGWTGLNFFNSPWWVRSKNLLNLIQPDPCTPLTTIKMDKLN